MKSTSHLLQLVLLALCAALANAGPAAAPTPKAPRMAINPQPLPPRHIDSTDRIAINPQPLPPQDPEPQLRRAPRQAYIGETEKNWR